MNKIRDKYKVIFKFYIFSVVIFLVFAFLFPILAHKDSSNYDSKRSICEKKHGLEISLDFNNPRLTDYEKCLLFSDQEKYINILREMANYWSLTLVVVFLIILIRSVVLRTKINIKVNCSFLLFLFFIYFSNFLVFTFLNDIVSWSGFMFGNVGVSYVIFYIILPIVITYFLLPLYIYNKIKK